MTDPTDLGGGFASIFAVVPVLVLLGFVVVVGSIVYRAVRYAAATPQTERAVCVAKRLRVSGGGSVGDVRSRASTSYFATFDLADGRRLELQVPERDYGLLAEGDRGTLTWRDVVFTSLMREPGPPPRA
ncbi:DUF2500 domain-containing protein [Arsenicicoccus dermatophilus]|uniref:DUF2500 domain-containing protein n=1 Tax=Arsenicicoccus dermatophilus TaxID=1076331 RepID=UPI0039170C0A